VALSFIEEGRERANPYAHPLVKTTEFNILTWIKNWSSHFAALGIEDLRPTGVHLTRRSLGIQSQSVTK